MINKTIIMIIFIICFGCSKSTETKTYVEKPSVNVDNSPTTQQIIADKTLTIDNLYQRRSIKAALLYMDANFIDSFIYTLYQEKTIASVLNLLSVDFKDTIDIPKTVLYLGSWANNNLEWRDLNTVPIHKNFERGKRICASGKIWHLSVVGNENDVPYGQLSFGNLSVYNATGSVIIRFTAARSIGDLRENSTAKFCGIITGAQEFKNQIGISIDSVSVVGMFDLLENKKPPPKNIDTLAPQIITSDTEEKTVMDSAMKINVQFGLPAIVVANQINQARQMGLDIESAISWTSLKIATAILNK